MEIKLFLQQHSEEVFQWEISRLPADLGEIQKEMKSWDQAWRKESLEHYAGLGWSFVALEAGELKGYLLGQPLLFFNKWTQSLWIEHIEFVDDEVGFQLLDTAIRWAKTKHLQKVLFNSSCKHKDFALEKFDKFKEGEYLHFSTTKISEA